MGRDVPVDAICVPCTFCGGHGIMREELRYGTRSADEDVFTGRIAIVGETCPVCFGRGLTDIAGGAKLSS